VARTFRDFFKVAEPALTMASGFVATPVAGLAGLATANPSNVAKVQDALTYIPKTPEGRQGLATLGESVAPALGYLDVAGNVGNWAGNKVMDATGSPILATASRMIPEAISQLNPIGRSGASLKRGLIMSAKRAKPEVVEMAKEMAARGASRDEIYAATMRQHGQGYFVDHNSGLEVVNVPDNKMARTELMDVAEKNVLDRDMPMSRSFGEFYSHPEATRNPDLFSSGATITSDTGKSAAQYWHNSDRVLLNPKYSDLDSAALHEISHAAHSKTLGIRGTSVDTMRGGAARASQLDSFESLLKDKLKQLDKMPDGATKKKALAKTVEDLRRLHRIKVEAFKSYERNLSESWARVAESQRHMGPEELAQNPVYKNYTDMRGAPISEEELWSTLEARAKMLQKLK
jgi:hypothetical protein